LCFVIPVITCKKCPERLCLFTIVFFIILFIETTNGQVVTTSAGSAVDAPSESSVSDPQVGFYIKIIITIKSNINVCLMSIFE